MSRFPRFGHLVLVILVVAGLLGGATHAALAAAPVFSSVASPSGFTPPSGSLTLVILANDADGDHITLTYDPTQVSDMNPAPGATLPVFTQTVDDAGHAEATLTWATPVAGDVGRAFAAAVHGDDGTSGVVDDTFTVFVNQPPTVDAISDQSIAEGAALSVMPSASDPDEGNGPSPSGIVSYAGYNLPSGASVDATTGELTWTPSGSDAGTYSNVGITATDNYSGQATSTFTITVNDNTTPAVDAIANQSVNENATLSLSPSATDGDNDNLTWSLTNAPTGMTIDASTGAISWTPTYTQAGDYAGIVVHATDGANDGTSSFSVTVDNVNRAPSMNALSAQSVNENALLTVTPTATDPDGDALTYSGSNLPSGASVDATTGAFTWTPSYTQAGSYTNVTISASDGSLSDAQSFDVTVTNVNDPPSVNALSAQSVAEGSLLTVTPSATDPDGDAMTWSGTSLPTGASVDASTGVLTWTPDYTQAGSYTNVTLTAADGVAGTGSASFDITVSNTNRAPSMNALTGQSIAEGSELTVTPSASDPDGDALTYSGTNLPTGAVVDASTGVFTWTPDYTQAGSYTNVGLDVSDGSASDAQSFDITVSNTNRAPVVDAIANQTIAEGAALTVTPTVSDPDGDALSYSGANLPTGAAVDASTGVLSWTPDYTQAGSYTNVGIVASDGSSNTTGSFDITVSNTNRAPVVDAIANQSVTAGQQLLVSPSASDADGDVLAWTGSNLPTGATVDASTGQFAWTPDESMVGSYSNVTVSADDGNGGTAAQSFDITVTSGTGNNPPVIASIADQSVNEGQLLTVTPSGSDPDGQTLAWSGSNLPTGAAVDASTGVMTWTPDFSQAGNYAGVTLSASDGLVSTSVAFGIAVANVNQTPSLNSVSGQTVAENATLNVALSGSDPDNDALTFSLTSFTPAPPSGRMPTVTTSTGTSGSFAWAPTYLDAGSYTATIGVSDGQGGTASTSFAVTVTNVGSGPPEVIQKADTTVAEAVLSSIALTAIPAGGPNGLRWTLLTPAPPWASLSGTTGVNNTLQLRPGYASAESLGTNGTGSDMIQIRVRDGQNNGSPSDTMRFIVTVSNTNRNPVLNSIPNQQVAEAGTMNVTAVAIDPDQGEGDAVTYSLTSAPSDMQINSTTGLIAWMPDYNAAQRVPGGVYGIQVTATDTHGGAAARTFNVLVSNTNRPPTVDAVGPETVGEGALLTFTATGSDPDTLGAIASWTRHGTALGASIDPSTGVYSWTPNHDQAGSYTDTLVATDNNSGTGETEVQITVTNTNDPPVIASITDQSVAEASLLTVTPSGTDPDGDALTWSGSSLPTGASVDASTGVLTWTPDYTQAGSYTVILSATDNISGPSSVSFGIAVSNTDRLPVLDAIADQSANEGALLTVTPSASDPDADDVMAWSGTNLPSGASVNATTGMFTWTPDFTQAGNYSNVGLTVDDQKGGTASQAFAIAVANVNQPPVIASIADQSVLEGQLLTVTPSGSDGDGDALAWSGTNLPTGAQVDAASGVFTWTPDNTQAGAYSGVTLSASDGQASGSVSFAITVTDVNRVPTVASIVDQYIVAGNLLTVTPSGSDLDGDPLTWSGSNLPTGASVDASTGVFTWTPDVSQVGTYAGVTLSASDGKGGTASASFGITVDATNSNQPPVITSIPGQSVNEGVLLTVTPSASDPDGDVLSWTGSSLPSGSAVNATTGVFTWTPSFTQAGSYANVTLSANDGHGHTTSSAFSITVANVNHLPTMNAIAAQTVVEGTLLSVTPVASDQDTDDVLLYSGQNLPAGATVDGGTGAFAWTPDNSAGETNGGAYSVTLMVDDQKGGTASQTFGITVQDKAPVINTASIHTCTNQTKIAGLQATDDDNGYISWQVFNLPAWATFNANAGTITMTAPSNAYGVTFTFSATATDYGSGRSSTASIDIVVDCTPATVVDALQPALFNRHQATGTFAIAFDLLGEGLADGVTARAVSLARAGATLAADGAAIIVTGHQVTAAFDRTALAGFLGDVPSGTTADVTLQVTLSNGTQLVAPLSIGVTGLAADAAVRALPNPFQTRTTVEYVVPEDGTIDVAVYAADGRLVRSLASGRATAGVYHVEWNGLGSNGRPVPGGIYYVRGSIGATRVLNRMVRVR